MRDQGLSSAITRAAACAALLLSLLAACGDGADDGAADAAEAAAAVQPRTGAAAGLTGTLVDPAVARPHQVLTADDGSRFSLADRPAGELTALFFGFTHCPDICPTTLADLARARALLPAELAERVQVLFVTEDPARDTRAVVRAYLDQFDSSFIGLIGGNPRSTAILDQLFLPHTSLVGPDGQAVPAHEHAPGHDHGAHAGTADYDVDHTSAVYVFSPDGRSVVYTSGATGAEFAADFRALFET